MGCTTSESEMLLFPTGPLGAVIGSAQVGSTVSVVQISVTSYPEKRTLYCLRVVSKYVK